MTILASLKEILQCATIRVGNLKQINGKLMHATISIPNGWGLISPIIAMLMAHPKMKNYKDKTIHLNAATRQAIEDWQFLIPATTSNLMSCTDLIPALANYSSYCDASKQAVGSVWYGLA